MSAVDFDMHEYYAADYRNPGPQGVMSTAGAVPVVNDKGEVSMKKVKVQRYVSGKRPDYAGESSDSDEEPVFYNEGSKPSDEVLNLQTEQINLGGAEDRRLARLIKNREHKGSRDRGDRGEREIIKPEILGGDVESDSSEEEEAEKRSEDEEQSEEEMDEDEVERRRKMVLERARDRQTAEKDLLDVEDEEAGTDEESSEYEEYTDSEDDVGPRLKPVFVRKADRVTLQERDARQQVEDQKEEVEKAKVEMKKKESHVIAEQIIKEEMASQQLKAAGAVDSDDEGGAINTDDENEEEEYEAWKVRELKRIKKHREEREFREKEASELDKLRNMTEEERRLWHRANPKQITNKSEKGKYRFLQKYYHRGAFFLNDEEKVYSQDFSKPTLDDHFDKAILPKVMQVKNFGRSGRTKYTHLLDQDTMAHDSPWAMSTAMNTKFHAEAGGTKLNFSRPSNKRKDEAT